MFSFLQALQHDKAPYLHRPTVASHLGRGLMIMVGAVLCLAPLASAQDLIEPEMVLESPQRFWAKSFFFRDKLTAHPGGESLTIGDRSYVRIGTGKTGRNCYADSKLTQKLAALPLGQDYLFDATVLNRRTTYYLVVTDVTDPTVATAPITSEFIKLIGAQEAILEHQAQAVMRDVLYQTQISLYVHAKRNGLRFEDFFREESLQSDQTIEIIRQTVRMMERQTSVTPGEALAQFMKKALNDYYGGDAAGFNELAITAEEKARIDAELAKEFVALGREMPEPPPAPEPQAPTETTPPPPEPASPAPPPEMLPQEPVVIDEYALRTTPTEVTPLPGSDADEALWRDIRNLSRPVASPESSLPAITLNPPPLVLEPAPSTPVEPMPEIPAPVPEPLAPVAPPVPEPVPAPTIPDIVLPPALLEPEVPVPAPEPEPLLPPAIPEIVLPPAPVEPAVTTAPAPEPVPAAPVQPDTLLPDLFNDNDPLAPVIPAPQPTRPTPEPPAVEPTPVPAPVADVPPEPTPGSQEPITPEPAPELPPIRDVAPAIPLVIPETLPEVTPGVLDNLIRELSTDPGKPESPQPAIPEVPPSAPEATPAPSAEPVPALPSDSIQWPPNPEQDAVESPATEQIPAPAPKKGFFGRLFGGSSKETKIQEPPSEPVPPPEQKAPTEPPKPAPENTSEKPEVGQPRPENPPAEEPGGVYDPDVQFEFKFRKK